MLLRTNARFLRQSWLNGESSSPCPDAPTRAEIFRLHFVRRKIEWEHFELATLSGASEGFSGAEIEQAIVSSLYAAHAAQSPLTQQHVLDELKGTRPLSVLMAEQVAALREWARTRTVPAG